MSAGKAKKARNTAIAKWMERAWVELISPMLNMNGSGETYQSWNSDQPSGTLHKTFAEIPLGVRPPVSDSAIMSWSSSWLAVLATPFSSSLIFVPPCIPFSSTVGGRAAVSGA